MGTSQSNSPITRVPRLRVGTENRAAFCPGLVPLAVRCLFAVQDQDPPTIPTPDTNRANSPSMTPLLDDGVTAEIVLDNRRWSRKLGGIISAIIPRHEDLDWMLDGHLVVGRR